MSRSLANGDYKMVGAVRSSSDANSWYRVLLDAHEPTHASGALKLSCDCTSWTRAQRAIDALPPAQRRARDEARARGEPPPPLPPGVERTCKHTDPFQAVLTQQPLPGVRSDGRALVPVEQVLADNPLIAGVTGTWTMQERIAPIIGTRAGRPEHEDYRFFLLHARAGVHQESGIAALPLADLPATGALTEQVKAWAGWQVAAGFMRRGGFSITPPPQHFIAPARAGRAVSAPGAPTRPAASVPVGLGSLLTRAERTDQGDGLRPIQRAELLLETFLGAQYGTLKRHGYLDVASQRPAAVLHYLRERLRVRAVGGWALPHTAQQVVYRLRLDPRREYDRRVRVWIDGRYGLDLCIVRASYDVPVQDSYLTTFLGLLSDELHVLEVVGPGNVFGPKSDTYEDFGPPPAHARAA